MRLRVPVLSILSIIFYSAWRWDFVFLVVLSAAVDFIAAIVIDKRDKPSQKKFILLISLAINLGLLVFFKYTQFLYDSLFDVSNLVFLPLGIDPPIAARSFDILLPIGISFYTFQSISYTIDVYRGNLKPTNNFLVFFAYVSLWPQLIAGPILRASEVIPQLENPVTPSRELFLSGLQRVVIGLTKKVVVADTLAIIVDRMYANTVEEILVMSAAEIWLAAFLFGFQIYMDFSAYSDIAIGSGRMVGIKFPENFNWPYMSRSPKDFWQRWHISLSSWIRDYVYLPILHRRSKTVSTGGLEIDSRNGGLHRTWALYMTWFLMGLWHGANWTFALWGLYHATIILVYRLIKNQMGAWEGPKKAVGLWREFTWLATLFPMMAGWLFFRSQSLEQLLAFLSRLAEPNAYLMFQTHRLVYYAVCLGLIVAMRVLYRVYQDTIIERVRERPVLWNSGIFAINTGMILALIIFLRPVKQFIYFQF